MTTLIKVGLTPSGIDKAIKALENWRYGKLEPFADAVSEDVSIDLMEYMRGKAHESTLESQQLYGVWPEDEHEPGRLKRSFHIALGDGPASYRVIADAKDYAGDPYAKEEINLGGEHDFTGVVNDAHRTADLRTMIAYNAEMRREML